MGLKLRQRLAFGTQYFRKSIQGDFSSWRVPAFKQWAEPSLARWRLDAGRPGTCAAAMLSLAAMTPLLLLVLLSIVGVSLFVMGVAMMAQRQEGGSGRRPALFMIGGLAVLILGMLGGLVLKYTQSTTQPHFELPGTGIGGPASPPVHAPPP